MNRNTPDENLLFGNKALKREYVEHALATICEEAKHIKGNEPVAIVKQVESHTLMELAADSSEQDILSPTLFVGRELLSGSNRFRILRPHAEGGLGQVFIAKDEELGREVAIKEIKPHKADNPANRARFTREAEITGGLEHPGVVPVYGLGTYSDGRRFYAMRLIRGSSLKDAIVSHHGPSTATNGKAGGSRNLDLRRLLQRLVSVCETIEYAHSRGVMHRDIKPSNIMLGRHGETLVVDWGLAKPLTETTNDEGDTSAVQVDERPCSSNFEGEVPEGPLGTTLSGSESMPTMDGSALGTPPFMSPEQASGRLNQLGPASDIFSLGATLFAILTGRAPYKAASLSEILKQAQACDYPSPRSLKREIPLAIGAVCLKAMSCRPQDRYGSAKALAEDIERFLADEPVSARQESHLERAGRFARRNRSWVTAAASIFVIACVSALTTFWLVQQARQAKQLSEVRLLAESQKARSQELLALTNQMTSRRVAGTANWIMENRRVLQRAATLAETEDVRLVLRNELSAIECTSDVRWQRTVVSDFNASRLALTSSGKQMARGANGLNTYQILLQILDPTTGAIEQRLSFFADLAFTLAEKGADGIKALNYSPDDRYLLAGSRSGWIYQWSVPDYQLVRKWRGHSHFVNQFLFSADKSTFWTCSSDRKVKRWNLDSGQPLAEYEHASGIPVIGILGSAILVGGSQTALLEKNHLQPIPQATRGIASCCGIAPLGKLNALAVCQSHGIVIQEAATLGQPQSFFVRTGESLHEGTVQGIRIDSQSRWVATFDDDHFRIYDFATGGTIDQHTRGKTIYDVQFHPTEPLMYVASGDDLEEYHIHHTPTFQNQHVGLFPIQAIALQNSGKRLFSISNIPGSEPSVSRVSLSELHSSDAVRQLEIQSGNSLHMATDCEANRILIADENQGQILEVDAATLAVQCHSGNVSPKLVTCFSGSGGSLFVSRAPCEFSRLLRNGPFQLSRLVAPDQPAETIWKNQLSNLTLQRSDLLAIDMHENLAAFSSDDNHLRLLDTRSGQVLWEAFYKEAVCNAVAIASDRQRLIAGDTIGQLHVYFPGVQREPIRVQAHRESITAISMSESGLLISGSHDRWLKLWQLNENGLDLICEMGPLPQPIALLKLSQDGAICGILQQKSRSVQILRVRELLEQFRSRNLLLASGN